MTTDTTPARDPHPLAAAPPIAPAPLPPTLHPWPPRSGYPPLLCQLGLHWWDPDVRVSGIRDYGEGRQLCAVSRRCRRCPLVRHDQHRVPPHAAIVSARP